MSSSRLIPIRYATGSMMKPIAFLQQPPAIILGVALLLLPVVTSRGGDRPTQALGPFSSQQVRSPFTDSTSLSGTAPFEGGINSRDNPARSSSSPQPHEPAAPDPVDTMQSDIGISFGLGPWQSIRQSFGFFNRSEPKPQSPGSYDLPMLFEGDSDSLVAKAVGAAEGTRTPAGGYTSAYQGHVDPGNGVWNLGTFSYQHGASSPEAADKKQLQRLQRQATQIRQRAERVGITLGLEEELNGIDLANQSPLAALGEPGYAEWLAEAYSKGYRGKDAILWARVMGYWDVRRNRWNAPGLGNTEPSIRRDQSRRMEAIAHAIDQGTPLLSQPVLQPDVSLDSREASDPADTPSPAIETRNSPFTATRDPNSSTGSTPGKLTEHPSEEHVSESDGSLDFGLL